MELLSDDFDNSNGIHLENFLTHVLNIFRLMFNIGFYGNRNLSRNNSSSSKDICKIRNLLLNSIQIDVSLNHCHTMYRTYVMPIFFNFIFHTDEWIDKFNRVSPDPLFILTQQSDRNEHHFDNRELLHLLCDNSKTDLDGQIDSLSTIDESDSSQIVTFVPFPLKSIALRTARSLLIANLGKDGFFNFDADCGLPAQLCDDIRFVERPRMRVYCDSLSVVLEWCPHKLRDVIAQPFFLVNDLIWYSYSIDVFYGNVRIHRKWISISIIERCIDCR